MSYDEEFVSIEEIITEYTSKAGAPFTLKAMVKLLKNRIDEAPPGVDAVIEDGLSMDQWTFRDSIRSAYVPREYYFRGKQFRARLDAREIEGGFFIPGQRLIPFISREKPPSRCRLFLPDGKKAPQKIITMSFTEASRYYRFFSAARRDMYLLDQDPANQAAIDDARANGGQSDLVVKLTAVDLSDAIESHQLKRDDEILFTIKSWKRGHYEVNFRSGFYPDHTDYEMEHWVYDLSGDWMDMALEEYGPTVDLYEQLSEVVFWNKRLLEKPIICIEDFIYFVEDVKLTQLHGLPLLWRSHQNVREAALKHHGFRMRLPLDGDPTVLANLLYGLGSVHGESELISFMRNELYQGQEDMNQLLRRLEPITENVKFRPEVIGLIRELWDQVHKDYDREKDAVFGEFRKDLLAVYWDSAGRVRAWERSGFDEEFFPPDQSLALSMYLSVLKETVADLNDPDNPPEDADKLPTLVTKITKELDYLLGETEPVPLKKPKAFQVIVGGAHPEPEVFSLRVNLLGANHIWRYLVVPRDMLLSDLHDCIQVLLNWTKPKQHFFEADGVVYTTFRGDPLYDELTLPSSVDAHVKKKDKVPFIQEKEVTVADVLVGEDGQFVYYCGDKAQWRFRIMVDSVITNLELDGVLPPFCDDGENPMPTEDLGGNTKAKKWLKENKTKTYDNEPVDVEVITRRLYEYAGYFDSPVAKPKSSRAVLRAVEPDEDE